jgi:predicted methyltransferase
MIRRALLAAALALAACATSEAPPRGGVSATAAYDAAIDDASRPADDRAKDAARKPAETLAFARVTPGQSVAELLPGGGYFTRLLSKAVGPNGKVHAIVPAQATQIAAQIDPIRKIAADAAYANVYVETPDGAMTPSAQVDVYFTAQNYHDIHAYYGAEAAKAFNSGVFAVLKPGGMLVVIDHSSVAGAGVSVSRSLHRIEASVVRKEIEAAGFVFDGESAALALPADPRTQNVFDPAIRGKTDQFMMRFKKPG